MNLRIPLWQSLLTKDYNIGWNDYNGVEAPFTKTSYLAHVARRKSAIEIGMVKIDLNLLKS